MENRNDETGLVPVKKELQTIPKKKKFNLKECFASPSKMIAALYWMLGFWVALAFLSPLWIKKEPK